VLQAWPVTAFTLHIVIALVLRTAPSGNRVCYRVAEVIDSVTRLTQTLHATARLERFKRVGVRGGFPLCLLRYVAAAAHGFVGLCVAEAEEVSGVAGWLFEVRAIAKDNLFVDTSA
jgi:hypothetical protein